MPVTPAHPGATDHAEPWTTRRLLTWMAEAFTKAALDSPRLQAEMLLAHVIGCQRIRLFTEPERVATGDERARLRELVARALRHEPIDYLIGERSFFAMAFGVDARVLVPRPSTETLVEHVLQSARRAADQDTPMPQVVDPGRVPGLASPVRPPETERTFTTEDRAGALSAFKPGQEDLDEEAEADLDAPPPRPEQPPKRPELDTRTQVPVTKRARALGPAWRIADVCTGSGCVAIALAAHLPRARLVATDVSADALDLARVNACRHAVADRVEFRRGDLLTPLGVERFDVIVSNPPYISDAEWQDVPLNVKDHEPTIALRGGHDGMQFIRPLLLGAAPRLHPGGILAIETATSHARGAADLAHRAGLVDVRILKDHEGLDRVVVARAPR